MAYSSSLGCKPKAQTNEEMSGRKPILDYWEGGTKQRK
uniref:Uncharacterized protein n=1 Tax=Nelumbo nucifera TaxID=4432 RepID=A0A822Y3E9_NELNU|nr:TPA_asm: hypothetical protein HUJ06_027579 [Nelumbo nucifera]